MRFLGFTMQTTFISVLYRPLPRYRSWTFEPSWLILYCKITLTFNHAKYIRTVLEDYHTFRHLSYYLFHCSVCAASIRGRLLFKGSVYFFGKPGDINDGWIGYEWVRRWRLLDAVSSMHSLSVLLSAVGTTRTAQTVLALAWWLPSEIIRTSVHMPHSLTAATLQGRHLFRSKALDCVATIQGGPLFEGGVYSKKYGILSGLTTLPCSKYCIAKFQLRQASHALCGCINIGGIYVVHSLALN